MEYLATSSGEVLDCNTSSLTPLFLKMLALIEGTNFLNMDLSTTA